MGGGRGGLRWVWFGLGWLDRSRFFEPGGFFRPVY